MGQAIVLLFPQSWKGDIAAKSRAFSSMTKTGMEPKDAARIVGLSTDFQMTPTPEPAAAGRSNWRLDEFHSRVLHFAH